MSANSSREMLLVFDHRLKMIGIIQDLNF